jgi:hypothetical protein
MTNPYEFHEIGESNELKRKPDIWMWKGLE